MSVNWAASLRPLLVPIDRVRQHEDNPNNNDVEELVKSIQVNGFYTAITADAHTGEILAGNHRYQALHALNATEIPVVWVERTEADRYRILVGDNVYGQQAKMEPTLTLKALQKLIDTPLGLAGTGIDDRAYERIMEQVASDTTDMQPMAPENYGRGMALNSVFQVVVTFDNADERDEAYTAITDHYGYENMRTVDM